MRKSSLVLVVILLVWAGQAEEDKYRGPSEEDVIVLDMNQRRPGCSNSMLPGAVIVRLSVLSGPSSPPK
jgi:hypothetical protein